MRTFAETKPTVLVVDDAPENLALMSRLLKDHYRVKVATGGELAMRIASTVPQPELILLDVVMPQVDGITVCTWLKTQPATRDIPVIFVTAQSDLESEEQGLLAGAADYVTKPVSPLLLLARIHAHLMLYRANKELQELREWKELRSHPQASGPTDAP